MANTTTKDSATGCFALHWLVWPFFFLTCVSFFYIGKKAKSRVWLFWGFVYLVALGILMGLTDSSENEGWFDACLVIFWVGGIVHAFFSKEAYLRKIRALEEGQEDSSSGLSRYDSPSVPDKASLLAEQYKARQQAKPAMPPPPPRPAAPAPVVDLNTCDVSAMTGLPGISIVMAKQAMQYRDEHGGFQNPDEFFRAVNAKPHVVAMCQERVSCSPVPGNTYEAESGTRRQGRKLDL